MNDTDMKEVVDLTPESPKRLRECLTVLASHSDAHVLRVEIGFCPPTIPGADTAIRMMVTHSMGPEHEQKIAPELARLFFEALDASAEKRSPTSAADVTETAVSVGEDGGRWTPSRSARPQDGDEDPGARLGRRPMGEGGAPARDHGRER